ncbi:MAG: hypothetical protein QM778_28545 [Myxococcales bacterium]
MLSSPFSRAPWRSQCGLLVASWLLLALWSAPARAQDQLHLASSPYDLSAQWALGVMSQGGSSGVLGEPQLSFRYGFLVAGFGGRLGLYDQMATSVGGWGRAGLALALQRARFELTGLAGVNAFYGLEHENELLDVGDPGYDVTLPFAGARFSGGGIIHVRRVDLFVGVSFAYERDLRHGYRGYTYTDTPFLGDSEDVTVRHEYGWTRIGGFVQFGAVWPGGRKHR